MSVPAIVTALQHYNPAQGKGIPFDHVNDTFNNTMATYKGGVVAVATDTSTGAVSNYGLGDVVEVAFTGSSPLTITGVANGVAGRTAFFRNLGTSTVKIATGSSGANAVTCPTTQGQILGVGGLAMLRHNGTQWFCVCIEPGAPISWTPTLISSGGAGTPVYSQQIGQFTQCGAHVKIHFRVSITSVGTLPAGNLQLSNLPVAMSTLSGALEASSLWWSGWASGYVFVMLLADPSIPAIDFWGTGSATGGLGAVAISNFGATGQVISSAAYVAA